MGADLELMEKITKILRDKFRENSSITVKPSGIGDNIHVIVMSNAFDDMSEKQKQDCLWSPIDGSDLTDEQKVHISMILPLSPDDVS